MTAEERQAREKGEAELRASGIAQRALRAGAQMPPFALGDAFGATVDSKSLLAKGPIVLVFYRGAWCPFCNLYLHTLQQYVPEFRSYGASLVAVSGEPPDRALALSQKHALTFTVLSDPQFTLARQFGIVYEAPAPVKDVVMKGFDIAKHYGTAKPELPLAATYVIDSSGKIAYAFVETDYRKRAEPADLIAVLKTLGKPAAKSVTERAYDDARSVVDAAWQATGTLDGIRDIAYSFKATVRERGQSVTPADGVYLRPVDAQGVIDLAGKRNYRLTTTRFTGGAEFRIVNVLKEGSGFTADLTSRAVYPFAQRVIPANTRAAQRAFPILVLQEARSRAATLRRLPDEGGQKIVSASDVDGNVVTMFIDAKSGLLTKIERLTDTLIEGLATEETSYGDYRKIGGVMMPFHVVTKLGGDLQTDLTYDEIRVNSDPSATLFALPVGFDIGPEAGGPQESIALTRLAEGVYYVNAIATNSIFFYSSMFVVFGDSVLVVETPLNDRVSRAIIAKIHEIAPGKPIRYVVPTHHHTDHTGGIRAYIDEGATIVTTAGVAGFLRELAAVEHPLDPSRRAGPPRAPSIEVFAKKRVFSDATQVVELYDVGPSPHAGEIVMAYLPNQKIAFVSDLFPVFYKGTSAPTSPVFADFERKIRALPIDTFASGHGRLGTMEELKRSIPAE